MTNRHDQIFSNIRVLDLTKVFSGPLATRYLADYGAQVTKVENPHQPDPASNYPPIVNQVSGYYYNLNHNKTVIYLDLKLEQDLQKFYSLVRESDIVVENMTPSVKSHLKIDYQTLKKINPSIIYASLAGKDQQSDEKYFDIIAQAESGLMSLSGTQDHPVKVGPSIVDAFSEVNLAFALAGALYHRKLTGKGQFLSVSMLGVSVNLLEQNLIEFSITGHNPTPPGNQDNAIAPFGIYPTQDGSIVLAIGSDQLWHVFCQQFPNYQADLKIYPTNQSRLDNQLKLTQLLTTIFTEYRSVELIQKFKQFNIPSAQINTMADVIDNQWFYTHSYLSKKVHPALGTVVVPGEAIKFCL